MENVLSFNPREPGSKNSAGRLLGITVAEMAFAITDDAATQANTWTHQTVVGILHNDTRGPSYLTLGVIQIKYKI